MIDTVTLIWVSFGGLICVGVGLLFGRILDIHWRAKTLRSMLKRDYGLINIVNKDYKVIKSTMIDFNADELQVGPERWISNKHHIYRKDKREKGFFVDETCVKWEEGVPVIYVDHDHLTPVDFYPPDGTTKPIEISAWLTAWDINQRAKEGKGASQQKTILIILAILVVGALVMLYYNLQTSWDTQAKVANLLSRIPANAVNATMTIVQKPT